MDYQIILLPRKDYWAWVQACKEYVLTYGATMTPDVGSAVRYMAPRQVITYPTVADGFPEEGDIREWLASHVTGIRTDGVEAQTPAELRAELVRRIEEQDRYGQRLYPFSLAWPTDYAVITQAFGANPDIYAHWGLPGHEGVDVRAPMGANIYCCAKGEVYSIYTSATTHPYGLHIRVLHRDGYRTVYAHLSAILVAMGDQVERGQLIGKADATGNSTGSHLHLTLKRDGATERGETTYPKDILDPTPFLVWPGTESKSAKLTAAKEGPCLVGAHGRIGGCLEESDLRVVEKSRLEALKISQKETDETLRRLRKLNPQLFLVARLTTDLSSGPVSADEFVSKVSADMARLYKQGVRYFEIHSNPNLQLDGWRRSWDDGVGFGRWFVAVTMQLKQLCPEALLGFPGLSLGASVSGWRQNWMEFLEGSEEGIARADWIGVNCHWANGAGMRAEDGGRAYEEYRLRFPKECLMITEFNNPSYETDAAEKARQYVRFWRGLREIPHMKAAFAFPLSARSGYQAVVWRDEKGTMNEIAEVVGARPF